MLELSNLYINARMLKDFSWKLNESPLTIVRGLNLDEGKQSTNYVGKSFIWASVATMLTGENAYVGDKKTAKLLYSPNSIMSLDLKLNKQKYKIEHSFNKTLKISLSKNGTDITPHQKPQAALKVQNTFGINSDVFYSQIYVTPVRPSILLYGTVAQRYDYFERMFSMQIYDAVTKLANKHLNNIRIAESQLKILYDEYKEVQNSVDPSALAQKISRNRIRFDRLHKKLNRLNKIVEAATENKAILAQFNSKHLKHDEASLKAKLETLRKEYNLAKEQNEKYIIYVENKNKIQKIKEKLETSVKFIDTTAIEEELRKAKEYLDAVAKYEKYLPEYEKAKSVKIPFDLDYKAIKAKIEDYNEQLSKIQGLKEGDCIECGQSITKSHIKSHVKKIQTKIEKLNKDLPIARLQQVYKIINPIMSKFEKSWTTKDVAKLKSRLDEAKESNKLYDEQKHLRKQILDLQSEKVKKPDLNYIRDEFNKVKENLLNYRQARKLQDKLNQKYLNFDLESIKTERDLVNAKFLKLNERQHPLMAQYQEGKLNFEKKLKLEKKIKDIERATRDRECYEHISKNYSTKGMRIQQIQMLVQNYIDGLNQMAPLLFSKKVTFSAKVDSNTSFYIFLTRNGETGDVRTLSGAESRMFLALSAVVFSQLLPDSQRCSHIILDELESCMSPQNVEIYSRNFIPEICKLYKHVIVVTPTTPKEMSFIGANEKIIVKQNNISRWA